jgi:hypothetical protein
MRAAIALWNQPEALISARQFSCPSWVRRSELDAAPDLASAFQNPAPLYLKQNFGFSSFRGGENVKKDYAS